MEPLIISASRNTPDIHFEPSTSTFEVSGISVPENASEFYQPVAQWLVNSLPHLSPGVTFVFRLTYFNSTSLKAIYQLLKNIKDANTMGASIKVQWHAEVDDEFMLESAEMYSEMLGMPIELVEVPGGAERKAV